MIVEIAVIGTGGMGRNHARILSTLAGVHRAATVAIATGRQPFVTGTPGVAALELREQILAATQPTLATT